MRFLKTEQLTRLPKHSLAHDGVIMGCPLESLRVLVSHILNRAQAEQDGCSGKDHERSFHPA